MKVKLLTTISFLTYQLSISQTEKLLKGKVHSETILLKDVEVINKTAKTSTRTNELGEFSILVNVKDSLIFYTKDYSFKRLKVTSEIIESKNILIEMSLKPEELKEVVLTTIKFEKIKLDKEAIQSIKNIKISRDLNRYISGYNDGRMPWGVDYNISLDKKPRKNKKEQIDFKRLAQNLCSPGFFIDELKLNPNEKDLFLEFCETDSKSEDLLKSGNTLSIMDFLYAKNTQFQKLKKEPKN
ncbi:hypothetical protein C8C83_1450 [Flavobacterium sp. 90]|uniref:hypothetical protein n=1 Tax=unclassified Flavobacterium TaxID=196869 RepID=UPI000EB5465A|nr:MULTISPECIES: hypothetical protein [unclassified Flavobacterium]RKR09800.1 hypothetical protein C8C82_1751 [Flavobacterium sp. 81]TCK53586.1 hypothetical protein C8C83_1450 [Flavobacterium sp. 90]